MESAPETKTSLSAAGGSAQGYQLKFEAGAAHTDLGPGRHRLLDVLVKPYVSSQLPRRAKWSISY